MATAVICLVLIMIAVLGIRSYAKKLSSGCCGTGTAKVKKLKVQDKNSANYPYIKTVRIYGMVCGNCVNRVENALNSMEGVWSEVNLSEGTALVRMKEELEDERIKQCIHDAGYTVLSIEK